MNVSKIRGLGAAIGLAASAAGLAGCALDDINEKITTEKLEQAIQESNVLTQDEFKSFRDTALGDARKTEPLKIRILMDKLIEVKNIQLQRVVDSTANETREICNQNIKNRFKK